MYSFAQRPDTVVLDEPYYAVYLSKTGADHPGKQDVLRSQSSNELEVTKMILDESSRPVLFIKNMAHHIEVISQSFLSELTNIFLIRDPGQIISSYAQVIEKPVMRDIGIRFQYELFQRLQTGNSPPVVVDSGLLLNDPAAVIRKLCDRAEIPFLPEMLQWNAGPKNYDGVWAKYWYGNVHRSTGFERQPSRGRELDPSLVPLYTEALACYQKLLPFAIEP
jgi:hypothetical protein